MKAPVRLFAFCVAALVPTVAYAADFGRDYRYRNSYDAWSVMPRGIYYGKPYRWQPPAVAWRRDYWVTPVYGYRRRCCLGARPVWGGPGSWGRQLHEPPPWVASRPWSARRRW
ncbi:hypothetical protein [Hyphomicrobium sp.]|jgi:hypothetical protein|uniref:hypothetical protein n=1 Tax=Hyphomicrobium sp. TaxID=82 RepID=UPI002BFCFAC0|nr:hypothetical protein [Hyphomicrobium sp.]HVZ03095.1 hypothetical protein [Hyphomicrobium sp.]